MKKNKDKKQNSNWQKIIVYVVLITMIATTVIASLQSF
jgi:hypothetical protein